MVRRRMYELGAAKSGIRSLYEYGLERAKEVGPENVYDFSLGSPSAESPASVKKAVMDELERADRPGGSKAVHGYTVMAGDIGVRNRLAEGLNRRYGLGEGDASPNGSACRLRGENFYLTAGCAPALITTLTALTSGPEDEVIVVAPFFEEYKIYIETTGAKMVVLPPNPPKFDIDPEALDAHITGHTVAVMLNSPNNPTGVIYSRETLKKVAEVLDRRSREIGHPIYIISDEPYREVVYDGAEVPYIGSIYRDTIVCYSYSKALALPGERIGYVIVSDDVTDSEEVYKAVAGSARAYAHISAPSLFQYVAAAVGDDITDLEQYRTNRELLYGMLTELGYECLYPEGAFYMVIKALEDDSQRFCNIAARKFDLLIVSLDAFACPGYVRISYCVEESVIRNSKKAFAALAEYYRSGEAEVR